MHEKATEFCIFYYFDRPIIYKDTEWRKVADYDYVIKYYIGATHDLCNKLRQLCFKISVFFYNFWKND